MLNTTKLSELIRDRDFSIQQNISQAIEDQKQEAKSITETHQEKDLSKFKYVCWHNSNNLKFISMDIMSEHDYKKGNWHCIPFTVNNQYKHEHDNKDFCLEIYCASDSTCLKRLTKIIKRHSAGKKVEWIEL